MKVETLVAAAGTLAAAAGTLAAAVETLEAAVVTLIVRVDLGVTALAVEVDTFPSSQSHERYWLILRRCACRFRYKDTPAQYQYSISARIN